MMYRLKCLLVLSVIACGATINLRAQNDLEALLQDLGGVPAKKPEAEAPVPEPAPVIEEKVAEPAPAPVVEAVEPEPAPVAQVQAEPAVAQENEEQAAVVLTPAEAAADKESIVSELLTLEKIDASRSTTMALTLWKQLVKPLHRAILQQLRSSTSRHWTLLPRVLPLRLPSPRRVQA